MQKPAFAALTALVLGATLALSQPIFAGPKKGGHEVGAKMGKAMSRLNLTDAQKAQIKPILKDAREKVKALRADATLTPEQKKTQARAVRKETREKVAALLTPDQREKARALRDEAQEKRHGNKGMNRGEAKAKRHAPKL